MFSAEPFVLRLVGVAEISDCSWSRRRPPGWIGSRRRAPRPPALRETDRSSWGCPLPFFGQCSELVLEAKRQARRPQRAMRRGEPLSPPSPNDCPACRGRGAGRRTLVLSRSMKRAAGPLPPLRLPSRTATSKVRLPPSSFGFIKVTTASSTFEPSPPRTEMVALGGSLMKLSLPSSHCMMNCSVVTWPAARTGRSAKTIEFADTPVIVRVLPSSLAPAELRTNREGTGPVGVAWPMVFMGRAA